VDFFDNISIMPTGSLQAASDPASRVHLVLWNGKSNLPTIDGDLTSILYKISLKRDHLDIVHERALVAMYHCTNPLIVSQSVAKTNNDTIGTNWAQTGEFDVADDDNADTEYQHRIEVHRSINKARKQLHTEKTKMWGVDAEVTAKWQSLSDELNMREYYVPDDRQLARRDLPSMCWQEFQTERQYVENMINDLFGIPGSLRIRSSTTRNNGKSTEGTASSALLEEQTFNAYIMKTRLTLQDFLNAVLNLHSNRVNYNRIVSTPHDTFATGNNTAANESIENGVSNDSNKPDTLREDVQIFGNSLMSTEETLQLFQSSVLTAKECIATIRQSVGLGTDQIDALVGDLEKRKQLEFEMAEQQLADQKQTLEEHKQAMIDKRAQLRQGIKRKADA